MKNVLAIAVLILGGATCLAAEDDPPPPTTIEELDATLEEVLADTNTPGLIGTACSSPSSVRRKLSIGVISGKSDRPC